MFAHSFSFIFQDTWTSLMYVNIFRRKKALHLLVLSQKCSSAAPPALHKLSFISLIRPLKCWLKLQHLSSKKDCDKVEWVTQGLTSILKTRSKNVFLMSIIISACSTHVVFSRVGVFPSFPNTHRSICKLGVTGSIMNLVSCFGSITVVWINNLTSILKLSLRFNVTLVGG